MNKPHSNRCAYCAKSFTSLRTGALTCSPRCRVALHRKTKAPSVTRESVTVKSPRPEVGRADLSLTAQQKLDAAVKRATKEALEHLQASYEATVEREVRKRVQERLSTAASDAIKAAEDKVREARQLEGIWRRRAEVCVQACNLFMKEWRKLTVILHPDRVPPGKQEQYAAAFDVVKRTHDALARTDLEQWGGR